MGTGEGRVVLGENLQGVGMHSLPLCILLLDCCIQYASGCMQKHKRDKDIRRVRQDQTDAQMGKLEV